MDINFSIIILYHSGKDYLEMCLESIISTVRDQDEIIVFINNVEDKVHNVNIYSERVKYIHVYENLGYSKAANMSIEYAQNEFIIFCDQDICFRENWLKELWNTYNSCPTIGIAGANLINHIDNTVLDFGISSSEYNFMHPNIGMIIGHPLVSQDRQVQMICSGVILLRKKHLVEVGGFYEPFGTLYSDLDLCLRFKAIGLDIMASSKSIAYHFSGEFYPINREYKNHNLKADIKGVFMKRNALYIEDDAVKYYLKSYEYYKENNTSFGKYLYCNMMTVANYKYYENILCEFGSKNYDSYRKAAHIRDAAHIDLFTMLGRNIMLQGVPIVYFVDRFTSLRSNCFWWANRRNTNDIVVDRNANILTLKELLG